MDGSTMDMTRGKPWRLITAFAIPVLLSQVFQQLYNTADALIVGRFLGDEALAAVSSSGTLIFLIISFFTGMSMGASVTISRYFGAGDYARVSRAIHTNVLLAILCGIVLTVFGVALTPTFLRWMGTDPDVLPEAISYFRYYFFGILAVVMYNTCKGIMNALGDSRRPLYYLILSSLVNIVLDLLFIAVFHWGVWSAAAATTISQAVSMVLCLIHLTKKGTIYQVRLRDLRLDREMLGQIFRYGLPSGVQNSVIGFANVIVQSNINSFGKLAMAAYGAYSKLEGFAFLPVTSFTMALTTYVSQNLGAGEYDRAKKGVPLRHHHLPASRGADRRFDVPVRPAADRHFHRNAGGHCPRRRAGAHDLAVLLPAGLLARRRIRMPRRRKGVRAHDDHARVLVRCKNYLHHDCHAFCP